MAKCGVFFVSTCRKQKNYMWLVDAFSLQTKPLQIFAQTATYICIYNQTQSHGNMHSDMYVYLSICTYNYSATHTHIKIVCVCIYIYRYYSMYSCYLIRLPILDSHLFRSTPSFWFRSLRQPDCQNPRGHWSGSWTANRWVHPAPEWHPLIPAAASYALLIAGLGKS